MFIHILFFLKLLVTLIGIQFIISVDVLPVLFFSSIAVVSYASLAGSCLLLLACYLVRNSSLLVSVLGLFCLVYAFDTASSTAIASLWVCLSSLLLSLPLLASVHLASVYVLLSTITTTLFWVCILGGICANDVLVSYALVSLILLVLIWAVSAMPRLNHTVLILVQVLSKIYLYIASLLSCSTLATSDVASLLPATVLSCTLILAAMDVRTTIIVLSSIWLIQLTTLGSQLGLSSAIVVYLVSYVLLSILLLLLVSSSRSFSELCLLTIVVLTWAGMPLMSVAIGKLLLILCCLSWGSLALVLVTMTLWALASSKVILILLAESSSYPMWFLTIDYRFGS
jgi:hypothetical protein